MSAVKKVLDEFFADKELGIDKKKWSVIPKEQYKNLLERYMTDPISARIPYSVVSKWLDIVKNNVETIKGIGNIWPLGGNRMKVDEINNYFSTDKSESELWKMLVNLGFLKWAKTVDGKWAYSDLGLPKLEAILSEERPDMTAEEILILINRCINVVHPRSDLSLLFIEGGSKTCSEISGK